MEVMGKSSYHGQSEACSVYTSVQTLTLPPIICAAMSELLKIISLSFFICRMEIMILILQGCWRIKYDHVCTAQNKGSEKLVLPTDHLCTSMLQSTLHLPV